MARKVRIEYPGAVYHVMSRGDRREEIFRSDRDRFTFIDTLEEACERAGFLVHAYVLMPNHYHLLLETPEGNLVDGMRWLQGTYTIRFNFRNNLVGHVFQGRYKAIPVDSGPSEYFRVLSDYIHLNPARARILNAARPSLTAYPWSSYRAFVGGKPLPGWLIRKRIFHSLDLEGERASDRRRYKGRMEKLVRDLYADALSEEQDAEWQELRRGWYLGEETFRDRLEDLADVRVAGHRRTSYDRTGLRRHDDREAEAWLDLALVALKADRGVLKELRHSDPRKQALVWLLRSRTTVDADWLDARLGTGHPSNVSRAVAAYRRPTDPLRKRLKQTVLQVCKD